MTDKEILDMVGLIARTQAQLYYKSEEVPQPEEVVESVYMLIIAVVTIQLTRAGISGENLNTIPFLPDIIAKEMKRVGWNLESLAVSFNLD